jgi:hypothetical protein
MTSSALYLRALSLCVLALLAQPAAQAAPLSKADYKSDKARISADYKTDKAACKSQAGNAGDICVEEAKAKEKVAMAELEYNYTGKLKDQAKIEVVKADTAYAVAKEKCDDQSGNGKDVCVAQAKAVQTKALSDAKMSKTMGQAETDSAAAKRKADLKVANEKCEAMSGDSKTSCMDAAKASYGKI